ncbi:hypothetical protein CDD81_7256 [Ophiocordyceps australis]|uniref:Uncharacterized protein n=1 Tax=Ophiocordyceps australis TaxID=1399860 RepID=A0A2C5Y3T0_9HYPO|nr:hypothetical protein CDD81_7256 [Ophiocordyceps australis]
MLLLIFSDACRFVGDIGRRDPRQDRNGYQMTASVIQHARAVPLWHSNRSNDDSMYRAGHANARDQAGDADLSTSRYKISVSTWYSVASHPSGSKAVPTAYTGEIRSLIRCTTTLGQPKVSKTSQTEQRLNEARLSQRDQARLERGLHFCQV